MSRTAQTIRLAKKAVTATYRQNVIAIVSKSGKIVATSHNNMRKTHPASFNGDYSRCIHAEISAINRAANTSGVEGTEIYIWRFLKDGALGNSRPCRNCTKAIVQAKIKYMTFYQDGQIQTERVQ